MDSLKPGCDSSASHTPADTDFSFGAVGDTRPSRADSALGLVVLMRSPARSGSLGCEDEPDLPLSTPPCRTGPVAGPCRGSTNRGVESDCTPLTTLVHPPRACAHH